MTPKKHASAEFEPQDSISSLHVLEQETERSAGEERVFTAIQTLWSHKRVLLTIALRAAVLFLIIALLLPATFESKTELMPPDQQSGASTMLAALAGGGGSLMGGESSTGGMGGAAMSVASDLLGLKSSGALFISILKSDAVTNDIINRFDLRRVYWVKTYAQARKKLVARTSIDEDRKSGVMTITVTDKNRQRSVAIAQAYIDELNRMVATMNTSAAHRERVFLEGRLNVVKHELDQSAKDLSEFSSKNTTLDVKEQGRAMLEAVATLQGQKIAAESELRGLEQIYTPYNIRVKATRARIAELQHQLQKLGGAPTEAEPDIDSESMYPSIRQLPVVGLTYSDLFRRVKINETVYEVLRKEYELARVQEAKEIPTIKVLVPPEYPEGRSGPPRALIFLGGIMLSVLVGSAWILGADFWQKTDPQNPKKQFARGIVSEIADKLRRKDGRHLTRDILSEAFWRGPNGNHSNRNGNNHFE